MTTEIAETPISKAIDRVRRKVDARLVRFLDAHLSPVDDPDVIEGYRQLREFVVAGGKRIRPILCYWGWHGAGGGAQEEGPVIDAGAALELCHAGLLVHDDVMDGSDTRRGRPTLHRSLAGPARPPGAQAFGGSAAILLGVLAQAWADELLTGVEVGQARTHAARMLFSRMRLEVISGQYLDILAGMGEEASVERALRVVRYKTAKYTVERPLQIGGVLAGADPSLLEAYSRFGLPLGEAFQLRDDILGVFGDTSVTGKPVIDDLREGKRTVLIAHAFARARGPQRDRLRTWHGEPGLDERNADVLRQIIVDTGALAHVESLITRRADQALDVLREGVIPARTCEALALLVDRLTRRVV
ncbi:polyprenyl synthetase family protein [Planomonospora parontospora]|uniref:polyprenyl synthetase family protein n=1 Tax=Planomonospora parontospora TaxID=58119 RepID=UPI0016713636|nr:polyprenyl synthetase family protein [Planomonospora parontospora]GGL19349.1 putative polyprenyl synthetase [Planomonospora parontospora subsp. antibiotica]GII13744.1 putative polyprenyl synthetase [Planomonospora parontospora subsp. antibiotica]